LCAPYCSSLAMRNSLRVAVIVAIAEILCGLRELNLKLLINLRH
jgi:hypothetical protein